LIKLIPAPHEEKFNNTAADYLLRDGCSHLGLEFPQEVEARVNDYARGSISYDELKTFLIDGEIISPYFEQGFRPILEILPVLYRRDKSFSVQCFEKLDIYNDWVFSRDELALAMLVNEDFATLADLYEDLVKETRRRNEAIAERVGTFAESLSSLHILVGRLHAPYVADRLSEKFDVKVIILEDICLTPLDESIILRLKGFNFSSEELAVFLHRHREFAREAEKEGKGITDLLRDSEMEKRFRLKRYSDLA